MVLENSSLQAEWENKHACIQVWIPRVNGKQYCKCNYPYLNSIPWNAQYVILYYYTGAAFIAKIIQLDKHTPLYMKCAYTRVIEFQICLRM